MSVIIDDDLDVTLLIDEPTLLAQRLSCFLDDKTMDRVMMVLAQTCNECWDADQPCGCKSAYTIAKIEELAKQWVTENGLKKQEAQDATT